MSLVEQERGLPLYVKRGAVLSILAPFVEQGLELLSVKFEKTESIITLGNGASKKFQISDHQGIGAWAHENKNDVVSSKLVWASDLRDLGDYSFYLQGRCGSAIYTEIRLSDQDIRVNIDNLGRSYTFIISSGEQDPIWPDAFQTRICEHPNQTVYSFA